jgi:hypothetical protein
MRLIEQFHHFKTRAEFFPALDKAIQQSVDLLQAMPDYGQIESILSQLEMIRVWTANGRQPTKDERRKPQIDVILDREFASAPNDQLAAWADLAGDVAAYFTWWLEDATFQAVDEDDVPSFPEDEDDETHLAIADDDDDDDEA